MLEIVFTAPAPPPLALPSVEREVDVATASALIVALSSAMTSTAPLRAFTSVSALVIAARTVLPMSLIALDAAIARAMPVGANDAASDADAVFAVIREVSSAFSRMLAASMPVAPSPSMVASTVMAMRFSDASPRPRPCRPSRRRRWPPPC